MFYRLCIDLYLQLISLQYLFITLIDTLVVGNGKKIVETLIDFFVLWKADQGLHYFLFISYKESVN